MGTSEKTLSELVDIVKSWIPRRTEPASLSRDFWMPDNSCRVCYECDSHFTILNRRHHCRLCGRIFCAKCTENSIPIPEESISCLGDWKSIRACNYCYRQWEKELDAPKYGNCESSQGLSPSLSVASFTSVNSCCTEHSSNLIVESGPFSSGPYKSLPLISDPIPVQSAEMEASGNEQDAVPSQRSADDIEDIGDHSPNPFEYCMTRSDEDDDEYSVYQSESEKMQYAQLNYFYDKVEFDESGPLYTMHPDEAKTNNLSSSLTHDNPELQGILEETKHEAVVEQHDGGEFEVGPSLYSDENTEVEPVDFENNGLLWLPPEPEDEEDEREPVVPEDEDDEGVATGEWGYLRPSSSFGSGEYRGRDHSSEEHKKVMKNVVDGHFRALVSQLLQVENLPVGEEDDKESWLEIITSLSWEAATLLKPDTSRSGGMDPGGYVKIKCLASGRRSASFVVKGVVCKKNVAHRRMTSKVDKPRFLILGGALEYQRVTNLLSSFDTLLQQETDHLKMAVAKIDAHHPNVLLVEKSVSRFAQDYLLAKDISLVLNIKRPLLERIARCTGAQIVPSIDHLSSQKLGYCDTFHVEKFLEDRGTAGQGGKKLVKTLMFFEGCPKPLGCTILLKGANGDELKKVKHVLQYGVFAAYHLALETSFLADEGASLPELPLKSPITVALPDKPSSMARSISVIPGFTATSSGILEGSQLHMEQEGPNKILSSDSKPLVHDPSINRVEKDLVPGLSKDFNPEYVGATSTLINSSAFDTCLSSQSKLVPGSSDNNLSTYITDKEKHNVELGDSKDAAPNNTQVIGGSPFTSNRLAASEALGQDGTNAVDSHIESGNSEMASLQHDSNKFREEQGSSKEEFPPSPSDHQSILVSLSTRCVWKGTVCERAHLFRIKYYGSFDKPLGRFLRDHLFDMSYCCRSCEMPSEAHVHCYTHRQGSLTIAVKKFPEFLLPGEQDGKIWMWHRCLRCPRKNGFPPATRRVMMSDAAWGLSFGKFLELSFSDHAAASRVASCGHSLHRDCLRFYGFGKMVASFRYAPIDVHSVYLPPAKLEFGYDNKGWIQKEVNEVMDWAELVFTEVCNTLHQIGEKRFGTGTLKVDDSRRQIADLEGMLQKEKAEFEKSLRDAQNKEVKKGQVVIDILEINQLRRQLLFHSYMWDHRLVYAENIYSNMVRGLSSSVSLTEKGITSNEKNVETNSTVMQDRVFSSCDSVHMDGKSKDISSQGESSCQTDSHSLVHQDLDVDCNPKQGNECLSHTVSVNLDQQIDPLDSGVVVRRAVSEGQFTILANLSDTLDAAWTGETISGCMTPIDSAAFSTALSNTPSTLEAAMQKLVLEEHLEVRGTVEGTRSLGSASPVGAYINLEESTVWIAMPFQSFYRSFNKNTQVNIAKLDTLGDYKPVYMSSFLELGRQSRARLLYPVGVNDNVVPIYDEEPTSVISYTLLSPDYHAQIVDEREKPKYGDSSVSLPLNDSQNVHFPHSFDEKNLESLKSIGSLDDNILSMSGSRSPVVLDPLFYTKTLHVKVSFTGDGPHGKVRHTVTCYYAKRFEALRRICCPSELDFIRSLARCKKWGAQGGKSNVFFAKTIDERFIIKQVTKTELESFIKFAPEYFKYLSESIGSRSPTCLAKILGIYQITSKQLKGGKESRMDVLAMENLLFGRNFTRLYDLKGSSRSRYNADSSGNDKVLLDQNLIEGMLTSPIFVGNKAKRLLERAVWNDTSFLASIDVMDYSLLVGVDEEKHELVLGIIDFMRQYTWDKHLETWVKASGILGGPKNASPTVISPKQYKKRFRKAMSAYFLMVPDQWSPLTIVPSGSQSEANE